MGFRINTNVQSLSAQRNLSKVKQNQDSSLEKLSSGQRIVRAGDDAAGLAMSEKLKAMIRGSKQARKKCRGWYKLDSDCGRWSKRNFKYSY